jgi:phage terminase large subunit-like protein
MLSGDKMTRANLIEPLVAGKRVKILNGTWNKIYRENMVGFGKLKHDEALDLTVMALHILGFMNESVPQKHRANII